MLHRYDNMNSDETLLVVARKYNDVFYAVSIPEWHRYGRHILVIFADGDAAGKFPLRDLFDDVVCIGGSGKRAGNLAVIRQIRSLKKRIQCAAVTMSNMVLVANQYLAKISGAKVRVLLEDGLMNYYDFKSSESKIKRITQFLLGIDQRVLFDSVARTYLLAPDLARYYGGSPELLKLNQEMTAGYVRSCNMEGKVIFVGQCLYRFGYMSIETYNERVNRFIKQYHVDYYLPHAFALDGEKIDCPVFDLGESRATLEVFASRFDFTVYSFCSSVLYTTRIINPDVRSFLVRIPELSDKSGLPVIKKYCSGVIGF
mgnify:CR=1 FL=1